MTRGMSPAGTEHHREMMDTQNTPLQRMHSFPTRWKETGEDRKEQGPSTSLADCTATTEGMQGLGHGGDPESSVTGE